MWRRLTGKYYVKGYLDGYTDAETEFMHTPEDLDVAYWQGYNNAMVEMSSNDDNQEMSENDDKNGGTP